MLVEVTCEQCGLKFKVPYSQSIRKFCSRSCSSEHSGLQQAGAKDPTPEQIAERMRIIREVKLDAKLNDCPIKYDSDKLPWLK